MKNLHGVIRLSEPVVVAGIKVTVTADGDSRIEVFNESGDIVALCQPFLFEPEEHG